MKQLLYTLITLILTISIAFSQKNVVLVHGHNGNGNSWKGLNDVLDDNCPNVNPINLDNQLASTSGLQSYTPKVENDLISMNTGFNDIAICHSFGGIAIRDLDSQGSDLFGGFITVASPHKGALLANSARNETTKSNPSVKFYFESGCKEVVTDITSSLEHVPFANGFMKLLGEDGPLSEMFCDCGWSYLLANAAGFIGNGETVKDLSIGGANLQLPPPSKPSVGIQATLDSPVHWNLIDAFINDPRVSQDAGSETIPFNCTELYFSNFYQDFIQLWKIWNTGLGLNETKKNPIKDQIDQTSRIMNELGNYLRIISYLPTTRNLLWGRKRRKAGNELKGGSDWLDNSENGYNTLIGAGGGYYFYTQSIPQWTYICDCFCNGSPIPCDTDNTELAAELGCLDDLLSGNLPPVKDWCAESQEDYCWRRLPTDVIFSTSLFSEPSDGVVPLSSQVLNGADRNELVKNSHPSHFAEPNDSGVWGVIQDQVDEDDAVNDVFIIDNCTIN